MIAVFWRYAAYVPFFCWTYAALNESDISGGCRLYIIFYKAELTFRTVTMKRKILAVALTLAMVMSMTAVLSGCGGGRENR